MKLSKLILVCICFAGLTQLVWSQNSNLSAAPGGRAHGVPGYLDPRTGTFTTKVHAEAEASVNPDVTFSVRTGTWNFSLPVTLKTAAKSGDILACEVDVSTFDPITIGYEEKAATSVSSPGTRATCTVNIPYSWVLTNLTGSTPDTVTISCSVSLIHAYAVGSGSTSVTVAESSRETNHTTTESEAVPANGATTNITIEYIVI